MHALVDALEAAAEQADARPRGQRRDPRLVERRPRGRQIDQRPAATTRRRRCAASTTSGRITMPGPPPNGVSSTVRCLSRREVADVHRFERPQRPPPSALPASEWPSGPGNISGNRVSTVARQACSCHAPASALAAVVEQPVRRIDDEPPAARSTTGTTALVNGTMTSAARRRASTSSASPAPKSCTARTRAERRRRRRAPPRGPSGRRGRTRPPPAPAARRASR